MNTPLRLFALGLITLSCLKLQAAPTIVTAVPPATGTGPMQFTFSEAMMTAATTVIFQDVTASTVVPTASGWSGGTILACTPYGSWPAGHSITWTAYGASAVGVQLSGTTTGGFTAPSGASTGCDTNTSLLSLTVAKGTAYSQTSTGAALPTDACLLTCISLPCPRNATNVSFQIGSVTKSLVLSTIPGHLTFTDCPLGAPVDMYYPNGDYVFTIKAASSNQSVTVNFPSIVVPSAPHIANYAAAQAIDPTQPFALTWDALVNGTASDCVYVEIYGGAFQTPAIGEPGALPGTTTSTVIPANTLQANRTYSGAVTFYRYTLLTNGTSHVSLTYRASTTEFSLATTGGYRPSLTNFTRGGTGFAFDVPCSVGQALTALWCTNASLTNWQQLSSTNSTTSCVRFLDPAATSRARTFYRVRTGS